MISFQISCNVNHKVINGQYWKLHRIILFRSSWYKSHMSFQFYRGNFLSLVNTFFQTIVQIHTTHRIIWIWSFVNRNHKNFNLLMGREYLRYFAIFYTYPDSNPTAMLCVPWATSLWWHGTLGIGMAAATLRRVNCNVMATCFHGDLTALVLSMFETWQWPPQPWRPSYDVQCSHSILWDLRTTQQWSVVIWSILHITARWPYCVTGVLHLIMSTLLKYIIIALQKYTLQDKS